MVSIGQIVNQAIAVTLQLQDVVVLVITCHLFRIGSCTVNGIEQTVQAVIRERVAMDCTVRTPTHAADIAVVMAVITQNLCELTAINTCQPV